MKLFASTLAACLSLGVVSGRAAFAQPSDAEARAKETIILRLARSPDGLRFTPAQQIFLRDASSPDLKRLSDGTLLAVFDYRSDSDAKEAQIGTAVSKDEGRSWSPVKRIKITDRAGSPIHARHADVLPLSDGRVRMYFTTDAPKIRRSDDEKPRAACVIRSAITRDGERYRVEPDMGLRFHDLPDASAAVVGFKDRTHLYVSPGMQTRTGKDADDSVRHAIARDGRRFARVAPVYVQGIDSIGSIVTFDDRLRAYVTSEKGIRSMVSNDGTKWELESGVCLPRASDPAVTRLKNGSFLMLYAVAVNGTMDQVTPMVTAVGGGAELGPMLPAEEVAQASISPIAGQGVDKPAIGEDVDPADELVDASMEDDGFGFAPLPDFQTQVDYMKWYQEQTIEPTDDNAYDAYQRFMPSANVVPGETPEWPTFKDMFNGDGYDGSPGPWNPADHPEWEESRRASQTLLSQYREATKHTGYSPRYDSTDNTLDSSFDTEGLLVSILLPYLGPHRTLAKATLADAWRTENGKVPPDRMVDAWETVLRGAAHVGRGSTLIESLVAIAQRSLVEINARWALKQGVFDDVHLENALETLRKYDQDDSDPVRWVRGEHAFALDITQYLFTPLGPDGQATVNLARAERIAEIAGGSSVPNDDFAGLGADDARAAIEAFNGYFRETTEQMRIGYPEVRAKDLEATEARYVNTSPLTKLGLPSLSRYYMLRTRNEASRRATQLAYAMHLFKARNGHWPKSLDELPAEFGETMRTDPFTGRPFGYRVTNDGPTIYSLSENGVDDGGVHSPRWADGENRHEDDSDDFVFWPPQP